VSQDFEHWTAPAIILSADAEDDARVTRRLERFANILCYDRPGHYGYPSADLYGMTGFRYEGLRLGLMWFYDRSGLRPVEHGSNDDGIINIQLAYQRDGYWQRGGDREDFLTCGKEGEGDCGVIITAHTVVEAGDELRFYYTGLDRSHGWGGWDGVREGRPQPLTKTSSKGASINLATLRRDGFVSLDALYPEGKVMTKPLRFEGKDLRINGDAEHGQVVVEILDESGKAIPGYTREDCITFNQDAVQGMIQWKQDRNLASLQGKPVRLAFFLQGAKLYAFRFVQ
jgi:hypothetical protein